ncbi:26s proteasome regulatory particle subunit-like protein [Leptotrombidium deliense]|uniref:26s proteasome regulatory particle subunit-like protein n=1 Tax=Leptotrombidium deliense TaxID=299467 RepID=A0A443SCG0_9ACAR|nr:26s proteasome regulatory particle subunit-like protein [Leptotrombidium deliense]
MDPTAKKSQVPTMSKEVKPSRKVNENDLKRQIDNIIEALDGDSLEFQRKLLDSLGDLIQSSSKILSLPFLIQMLLPHVDKLKKFYRNSKDEDAKRAAADILSLLTTVSKIPETLHWRLLGSKSNNIGMWGADYVTHLIKDIQRTFDEQRNKFEKETVEVSKEIVKYALQNNSVVEGIDFLIQIESLSWIVDMVDNLKTGVAAATYIRRHAKFADSADVDAYFQISIDVYLKFDRRVEALLTALQLKKPDETLLENIYKTTNDRVTLMQMSLILGRQNKFIKGIEDKYLQKLMMNRNRHTLMEEYAKSTKDSVTKGVNKMLTGKTGKKPNEDLDTLDLEMNTNLNVMDLITTNALSNCSFSTGLDNAKQLMKELKSDVGKMAGFALYGFITLWDVNKTLEVNKELMLATDTYQKAGAVLALCTAFTGIRDEEKPFSEVFGYLRDKQESHDVKLATIIGLGIAYAGTDRKDVIQELKSVLNGEFNKEMLKQITLGATAVSIGLISIGSCQEDVYNVLFDALKRLLTLDRNIEGNVNTWLISLAIGLIFFGKEDQFEKMKALAESIANKRIYQFMSTLFTGCAFYGSGNVETAQQLLHICAEDHVPLQKSSLSKSVARKGKKGKSTSLTLGRKSSSSSLAATGSQVNMKTMMSSTATGVKSKSDDNDGMAFLRMLLGESLGTSTASKDWKNLAGLSGNGLNQAAAVIGVALIAMGENVSLKMLVRTMSHIIRECEQPAQRMAPLALALGYLSNPESGVVEILQQTVYHKSSDVACNAVLALGLVAAGTNNEKIAKFLRNLYSDKRFKRNYVGEDGVTAAKIALALLYTGKGALSLSPFTFDKQLTKEVSVAAVLVIIICCMDAPNTLLEKLAILWHYITPAICSKVLMTVDSDLKLVAMNVKVGERVDSESRLGKGFTVGNFELIATPTTVETDQKAEPTTDEISFCCPILEDIVITKKN